MVKKNLYLYFGIRPRPGFRMKIFNFGEKKFKITRINNKNVLKNFPDLKFAFLDYCLGCPMHESNPKYDLKKKV